jgi:hypothetical protein
MLTGRIWTLCSAFVVAGHEQYLFLNDATCEDAACEYGVLRFDGSTYLQVESITFSWCDEQKALAFIRQALAGEMDRNDFARPVQPCLEPSEKHGRCPLCA